MMMETPFLPNPTVEENAAMELIHYAKELNQQQNFPAVENCLRIALALPTDKAPLVSALWLAKGINALDAKRYEDAQHHLIKANEFYKSRGVFETLAIANSKVAEIYELKGDQDTARRYYQLAQANDEEAMSYRYLQPEG